jgi:hypothetical protein
MPVIVRSLRTELAVFFFQITGGAHPPPAELAVFWTQPACVHSHPAGWAATMACWDAAVLLYQAII